jgi:hypothetical protein
MSTLTPHALTALLRADGHGSYATQAATELLIEHHRWLDRPDFQTACINVDDDAGYPVAWVDWAAIPAFVASAPCSTTEANVLRLAAELVGVDTGIALGRLLAGLDDRNGPRVVAAVAHVALCGREARR